ncbi:MAG: S8 family serine peptidase [Proteobacteria bacterium]|nr:S8 family serine peptidase [Pseudomonadota bacterium]
MKKSLTSLLILFTSFSHAVTFHIMLSDEQGAPTPEFIVNESLLSPPPPSFTLQAFNVINATGVDYLIKERAIGNLRTIMDNSPDWARTQLQQYLSLTYTDGADINLIQTSLDNDPFVDFAYMIDDDQLPTLSVAYPSPLQISRGKKSKNKTSSLINVNSTDIQSAWELSEGMGYVGIADTGLQVNHPDLRAFDGNGNYVGGNLLDSYYSIDFAKTEGFDLDVDELKPVPAGTGSEFEDCDFTDGDDTNDLAVASFVGHGTHVSGLIGAKGGLAPGICKNCGISMMKFYGAEIGFCGTLDNITNLFVGFSFDAFLNSWATLVNIGVGTINLSGGIGLTTANVCIGSPLSAECLILKRVEDSQVLFTGAAGNNRQVLQFPASDPRIASAGGLDENSDFWNESPTGGDNTNISSNINCPQYPPNSGVAQLNLGQECGSNFSFPSIGNKTDVMTQSRNVYSVFYQGQEHNPFLPQACSDAFDGIANDGYGLCTGTSMSAPQTTAIFQLMRSANPLLPNGTYEPDNLIGLRNVLNATAERSVNGLGHDDFFGYGQPSARKALEMILGKSNGVQMKTRLTPMFTNVSLTANNNMYTPFPQIAMSFLLNNGPAYLPDNTVALVNEFPEFWYDTVNLTFPAPRAEFYVFTTNNNPFSGLKDLVPLRRMEENVAGNRNDTYAVSVAEIEAFHADGYNYAGIEGYILPTCSPIPICVPPPSAIRLYRDETDNLNHKLVTGFVTPPNSIWLGYVYLNQDSDGDGLIDGQEFVLGTDINLVDTDGDSTPDGAEYPAAGVPISDPRISDIIFANGFE